MPGKLRIPHRLRIHRSFIRNFFNTFGLVSNYRITTRSGMSGCEHKISHFYLTKGVFGYQLS
jgi:hypothetical protein